MPMTLFYIFASDCPHRTAGFFIWKNGRRFDIWKSIGYGCFFMGSRFHGFFEVMVDWTHTSIGIKRDAFLHVCWDAADGAEPNTFEVFCRWMPLAFFLGSSFWNQSFYETWNTMADRKVNSGRCQETFCQGTLLNDCQTGCCFNLDIFHLSRDDGPWLFFRSREVEGNEKTSNAPGRSVQLAQYLFNSMSMVALFKFLLCSLLEAGPWALPYFTVTLVTIPFPDMIMVQRCVNVNFSLGPIGKTK